jgi:hypothetical protein
MSESSRIKRFEEGFARFASSILQTPAKTAISRVMSDPKLYKSLMDDYWNKKITGEQTKNAA